MTRTRGWWGEPVIHFLIIGALLVLVQALAAPGSPERAILVSAELVRGLRADFIRRTGVVPTRDQERALVDDHIRNEMLYREALTLGLDKGDVIVRRRMIQKMHFLLEDEEPPREPTDADLQAYLETHAARYTIPARVAVSHVFASSDRHDDPETVALGLLHELAAGGSPAESGDPFLRGRELALQTEAALAGIFGVGFAAEVIALPFEEWSGPIRSTYGHHLVLVTRREPSRLLSLSEARPRLLRDWRSEEREKLNEQALERLREVYDVRVEGAGAA